MLRILKVHIYVTNAYLLLSYAYEKCLFIMIETNILWMETHRLNNSIGHDWKNMHIVFNSSRVWPNSSTWSKITSR